MSSFAISFLAENNASATCRGWVGQPLLVCQTVELAERANTPQECQSLNSPQAVQVCETLQNLIRYSDCDPTHFLQTPLSNALCSAIFSGLEGKECSKTETQILSPKTVQELCALGSSLKSRPIFLKRRKETLSLKWVHSPSSPSPSPLSKKHKTASNSYVSSLPRFSQADIEKIAAELFFPFFTVFPNTEPPLSTQGYVDFMKTVAEFLNRHYPELTGSGRKTHPGTAIYLPAGEELYTPIDNSLQKEINPVNLIITSQGEIILDFKSIFLNNRIIPLKNYSKGAERAYQLGYNLAKHEVSLIGQPLPHLNSSAREMLKAGIQIQSQNSFQNTYGQIPPVALIHFLTGDFKTVQKLSFSSIQDYIDHISIHRFQSIQGMPLIEFKLKLVLGMIQSLNHLHSHQLIHRDVKNENYLLDFKDDGDPIAQLIDFGYATQRKGQTQLNTAGTPLFMPPEMSLVYDKITIPEIMPDISIDQLLDLAMSPQRDIWSLGIQLYPLFFGELESSFSVAEDLMEFLFELYYSPPAPQHRNAQRVEKGMNLPLPPHDLLKYSNLHRVHQVLQKFIQPRPKDRISLTQAYTEFEAILKDVQENPLNPDFAPVIEGVGCLEF